MQSGQKSKNNRLNLISNSQGVALLLVIFIVVLGSILVFNLAYSANIGAVQGVQIQRSTEAEYLLKSAVNFARVLIKLDTTPEDSPLDFWAKFASGVAIPPDILQLPNQNAQIELEIRPEESKIPLETLASNNPKWREASLALCHNLDFDNDGEEDTSGIAPDRHVSCEQLIAGLVDYMDSDTTSTPNGGYEDDVPQGTFPNQPITRLSELASVPGFTSKRIRMITPFVTALTANNPRVNINLAPPQVLAVLHPNITPDQVQQMVAFRSNLKNGPFTQANLSSELTNILGSAIVTDISPLITVKSQTFQVLAKVDYGTSIFFMRAYIHQNSQGDLPDIDSVELF